MQKLHRKLTKKSKLYQKWHSHPYHSHLHWLCFINAFFIVLITLLFQIEITFEPGGFGINLPEAKAQNFNPPYPRVGLMQWGGAPAEWYAQFDLIVIRRGSDNLAREIKELNPNAIVLPTEDIQQGIINEPRWRFVNSKGEYIPIYGGGWYWYDYTDFSPKLAEYGYKQYREYVADEWSGTDFSIWDGVATDGLWMTGYCPVDDIDIDRNGKNDFSEHGSSWVREKLKAGARTTIQLIKEKVGNKIVWVNSGGFHKEAWDFTNGLYLEHSEGFYGSWSGFWENLYQAFMKTAPQPHLILWDGHADKDDFADVRGFIALMSLGDGYVDNGQVYNHYGVHWYDEYETNLGYPTTEAQKITETETYWQYDTRWVYARFFDNGVTIVNPTGKTWTITDAMLKKLSGYAGPYYKFLGGQNSSFNDGSLFTSITLSSSRVEEDSNVLTTPDGIILLKQPRTIVSGIIIDNVDPVTSPGNEPAEMTGFTQSDKKDMGSWQTAYAPWRDVWPYAVTSPSGGNIATFRPTIGVAGNYEVFEWHGTHSQTLATNVPYEIHHAGGTKTGTINQRTNYGKWNSLGTFYFNQGTNGYVKISAQGTDGIVIADAIKFVYKEETKTCAELGGTNCCEQGYYCSGTVYTGASDCQPPKICCSGTCLYDDEPPVISNVQVNTTDNSATISWTTDEDADSLINYGLTASYGQTKSDPILTKSHSLTLTGLQENTTYHFEIKSKDYNENIASTQDAIFKTKEESPCDLLNLFITADNSYELYFNGQRVGSESNWENAENYSLNLKSAKNSLAIKAEDTGMVAGLLLSGTYCGQSLYSGSGFKYSLSSPSGWQNPDFNDSTWPNVSLYGTYPSKPWSDYSAVANFPTGTNASWVWSPNNGDITIPGITADTPVYFRFSFTLSTLPFEDIDLNCDNIINIKEFGILLSHWEKTGTAITEYRNNNCCSLNERCPASIDISQKGLSAGVIDAQDISVIFSNWGRSN